LFYVQLFDGHNTRRLAADTPADFQHYTGDLSATTIAVLAEKPSVALDIAKLQTQTNQNKGASFVPLPEHLYPSDH
jgi:hypothetical protein